MLVLTGGPPGLVNPPKVAEHGESPLGDQSCGTRHYRDVRALRDTEANGRLPVELTGLNQVQATAVPNRMPFGPANFSASSDQTILEAAATEVTLAASGIPQRNGHLVWHPGNS